MIGEKDHKITELYAFIADGENGEGIISVGTSLGMTPLVGSDVSKIKDYTVFAKEVCKKTSQKGIIKRFALISEEIFNEK